MTNEDQMNITLCDPKNHQVTPSSIQASEEKTLYQSNGPSLVEKILTSVGCSYYQRKIMGNPKFGNDQLYQSLKPNMLLLINDQTGNYLYQQFLEILNTKNYYHFIEFVREHFYDIAYSPDGSKVIQKLIEKMDIKTDIGKKIYEMLESKIRGNVLQMSNHIHSTHIIQKIIIYCPFPYNDFIFEEIYHFFYHISTTKFGCCVIQKALLNSSNEQKAKIVYLVLQNTYLLVSNQFGNFIYQCLIQLDDDEINEQVYILLSKDLISLCKEKYSSNVIEKLFDISNQKITDKFVNIILQNELKIIDIICNPYGNYIIQKMLNSVNNRKYINRILMILGSNVEKILKKSFGKKLLIKLINRHPLFKKYVKSIY